ncbi:cystathionine beta-lyase [Skeletonema marinoi]|uniref:Cystathionine beta-lyase n=1 Tax=Skeletonema marinoi TaxID=267567 RepID=A0AAD8XYC1_9STRA|nr:cystathionine beta-lyase [Skeletonema marinoi]
MKMEWRRDHQQKRSAENKRTPSSLKCQQHLSRHVEGSNNETKAPVDKEKLRAMFSPDSDSDDDPIAAIKRRQIAANKRRRELKNGGLKMAAAVADVDNSIRNISNNNGESSDNSNSKFPKKRHRTTPPNDAVANERKQPESLEEVVMESASTRSDAIDLTVETNLTKDTTSTPKKSQSDLLPETSPLGQVSTLDSEKEVTITKKDNGGENNAANKTEQSANSKTIDLNVDAPMQKSIAESDIAAASSVMKASAQVSPAASAVVTPTETSPIVAKEVKTPKSVSWTSLHSQHLLVRSPIVFNPRDKVAAFDLDQTLANWNVPPGSWPSSIQQYELWNSNVIDKLRKLDKDGYKLVIFSNQGGVKGALHGKIAARVKSIIDWIAKKVGRPVFAICSTMSGSEYHKPNAGMWGVMETRCNAGMEVRPDLSFFVGDSDGTGEGYQLEGVDKAFAENVGRLRNVEMKFYTPKEYFGDSNLELRKLTLPNSTLPSRPIVPKRATLERASLLGGYLAHPLLLVLVGVQGSGKSTFCESLGQGWCHLSQDTINNGRPGERKDVEIGKEAGVNVHCLVFVASKDEVTKRVKERTNHPGGVEGDRGAKLAVTSFSRLVPPTYDEGFTLINYTYTGNAPILDAYRSIGSNEMRSIRKSISLGNCGEKADFELQMITLGTFKLKKQDVSSSISLATRLGINSLDTAPTYENEAEIGNSIRSHEVSVTVKVPKRAIHPNQAREEVMKSMSALNLKCADVVLLHWPSDLIEADTLLPVWKELESMKQEGRCKIAKESGMSPAQTCISWNLEQGVPVVVKSSTASHLREIAALLHDDTDNLALSANHMQELSHLSQQNHRFVAPPFMLRPGTVYSWEEAEVPDGDEYTEPAIPNTQFSIGTGEEKLPFVIYMAVREKKSSKFSEGIAACEASCPPSVHSHCFQRDGTRHITLFQGDLTKNQARMLRYEQDLTDVDVSLPLDIDFDGWMTWEAGCYLSVEQSCRRKLESLLDKIMGLHQGSRKCDHMSLYRSRKYPWHEFRAAVKRIKQDTNTQRWGNVEGVSIRLKIMQDAYEDCIVLAGKPRRIILLRHGESLGNADESAYVTTADWRIPLTKLGKEQAAEAGKCLREKISEEDAKVIFYHSPYLRTKQTLDELLPYFSDSELLSCLEEPRICEQQIGNFQNVQQVLDAKKERSKFGRFFYRFPSVAQSSHPPNTGYNMHEPLNSVSLSYQSKHASLLNELFVPLGMEFDFVDFTDPKNVEAAIKPNTKLIFSESPTNPTLTLADLDAISEIAQKHGILHVCDSTFATPYVCRPLDHGADLTIQSLTKYYDGLNIGTGGALIAKTPELYERIKLIQNMHGNIMSPMTAYLMLQTMKTMGLRVRQQSASAMKIATFLESHPQVSKVHRDGLHGGMLWFDVKGDPIKLMDSIKRPWTLCENLGATESIITACAVMTHANMIREDRLKVGITDGFIRISVGIEDPMT